MCACFANMCCLVFGIEFIMSISWLLIGSILVPDLVCGMFLDDFDKCDVVAVDSRCMKYVGDDKRRLLRLLGLLESRFCCEVSVVDTESFKCWEDVVLAVVSSRFVVSSGLHFALIGFDSGSKVFVVPSSTFRDYVERKVEVLVECGSVVLC